MTPKRRQFVVPCIATAFLFTSFAFLAAQAPLRLRPEEPQAPDLIRIGRPVASNPTIKIKPPDPNVEPDAAPSDPWAPPAPSLEPSLEPSFRVGTPVAVPQAPPSPEPLPKENDASDESVIRINTATPTSQDLFRMETETQFRARLMKETERWRDRIQIPDLVFGPGRPLPVQRGWPGLIEYAEPGRLCFFRLGFAQPWSERYGNTLGPIQPLVSASLFYGDIITWPVCSVMPPWTIKQCDTLEDLPNPLWERR